MRPYPEILRTMFPLRPEHTWEGSRGAAQIQEPERPWWHRCGGVFKRTDGCILMREPNGYWFEMPEHLKLPSICLDRSPKVPWTDEFFARADSAFPVPHPGIRPGQIWANDQGVTIMILSQHDWLDSKCNMPGRYTTEQRAAKLATYFLVSDQACPWLAPWAPPRA